MYMDIQKWTRTFSPEEANRTLLFLKVLYHKESTDLYQGQVLKYLKEEWNRDRTSFWTEEKVNEELNRSVIGLLEMNLLKLEEGELKRCKRKPFF